MFVTLVFLFLGQAFAEDFVYLHVISNNSVTNVNFEKPVEYRIQSTNSQALFDSLKKLQLANLKIKKNNQIRFVTNGYKSLPSEQMSLKPTFLVDHDEPVFTRIFSKVINKYGPKPTPKNLTAFSFGFLKDKNYRKGYERAAQTASSQSGDCTEHAIFLTALLRKFGHPARVVQGAVSLKKDGKIYSFGHAWTEYFHQGWKPLDATNPDGLIESNYLPFHVIENESVSFAFGILNSVSILNLTSLKIKNKTLTLGRK
jgi:hypothetical protein